MLREEFALLFQTFFGNDISGESCRGAPMSGGPHRAGLILSKKKRGKEKSFFKQRVEPQQAKKKVAEAPLGALGSIMGRL